MNHSIRQVLVHMDASPASALRLREACSLARHHGANVHALYGVTPVYAELPYAPDMAPAVATVLADLETSRRDAARAMFDRAITEPGPVATWGECAAYGFESAFIDQAFYADLLVLGQYDETSPAAAMPRDFVQRTVIASGKPALVIPYTGWNAPVGDVIAIAWKPSRESARAVTAALPLLQRARAVHVLAWGAGDDEIIDGARLDLRGFLRLHAVEAAWHDGGPEPDAMGEILLSRAFDAEADLLVMGCYGHSRARELVLGGASRTVLRAMTMPVLMAH